MELNRIKTEAEKIKADAQDVTTEAEAKAKAVEKNKKEDFHKFGATAEKTRSYAQKPKPNSEPEAKSDR